MFSLSLLKKKSTPRTARLRVALFCSFYRGFFMLEKMLKLQEKYPEIEFCGLATDDPSLPWANAKRRIWKYPHRQEEEELVTSLAQRNGISPWTERIKSDQFFEIYTKEWMPDICYMGVFGQKIPERIWSYPLLGFYNFHTCSGKTWPSNAGSDPLTNIVSEGGREGSIAMHQIDNEWDRGELVAFSEFFPVPTELDVIKTHKATAEIASNMMEWHLLDLLGVRSPYAPRFIAPKQHVLLPLSLHRENAEKTA